MKEDYEEYGPEGEEPAAEPDLFGRMNNWFLLMYGFACYLMATSLVGLLYLNGNVVLSVILPGLLGYILPLMIITRRYGLSFTGELRLFIPDAVTAVLVIVIAAAAIYPVDAISWLFRRGRPVDPEYINFLLAFKPKGAWHFAGIALGLGVITPLGEEILFRGVVQSIFHRNMTAGAAILLAALVFAVSHGVLYIIPGVAALGIILGFVFFRTGILTCAVLIHAIFNLFSLYRLSSLSEETIMEFDWSAPSVVWVTVSTIILLAALAALVKHMSSKA